METYQCLYSRRSVRHYRPKKIAKKDLLRLINAASLAPSGANAQPWYFYIIRDKKVIENMKKIILASSPDPHAEFLQKFGLLFNAPCIISVCLDMNKRWYHVPAGPLKVKSADDVFDNPDYFSVAAAIQNILLAAHADGIGSCWCKTSSHHRRRMEKLLRVKPFHRLVANITMGYYEEKPIKPARKSIKEICTFIG